MAILDYQEFLVFERLDSGKITHASSISRRISVHIYLRGCSFLEEFSL